MGYVLEEYVCQLANQCVDADHDGYSAHNATSCPAGNDCNDNDPTIRPGAQETYDNKDNNCDGKVDETCVGGDCTGNVPANSSLNLGRYNRFKFPHVETLKRYEERGARLYRTDLDGAITITSDGKKISLETN
ncbi:MAG: hypothetical protein HY886_06700 [Deltaproteobacteria bacterium]|nr:hypothetical protein [Deltaproteobacteria bacterium]